MSFAADPPKVPVDKAWAHQTDGYQDGTLSVLMPVYNEQRTLPHIIPRILSVKIPLQLELVVVDDASDDDSWSILQQFARQDSRVRCFRQEKNQGKGAAIRRAIDLMTGDIGIFQDADLEYDPQDYPRLLAPLLAGQADAVYGSRYAGATRRVHPFWHTQVNRGLTFLSNVLNNLTLSDMETCYKAVRADVLKQLRLRSRTFTLEPEITCRLAQWGARFYEVPVSYYGRTKRQGKKITSLDGVKAVAIMLRCRFWDKQFSR